MASSEVNWSMINAGDLSDEEVDYELSIRNKLFEESVKEKKERLKTVLEKEGSNTPILKEQKLFSEEFPLVQRKLKEIENGLKVTIKVKWISQLRHWRQRIHRTKTIDLAQNEQKYEILKTIQILTNMYKTTAIQLMNLSETEENYSADSKNETSNTVIKNEKSKELQNFEDSIQFQSSFANNVKEEVRKSLDKDFIKLAIEKRINDYFQNVTSKESLQINPGKNKSEKDKTEKAKTVLKNLGAVPKEFKERKVQHYMTGKYMPENQKKSKKKSKKSKSKKLPSSSSSEGESSSLDSLSSLISSESSSDSLSDCTRTENEFRDRDYRIDQIRNSRVRHYHLDKWGIQFSGDPQGMDVADFVFQVNELIDAEQIPNDRFLDQAFILFAGEARRWYFTYKKKYKTWDVFSKQLKIRFGDPNKDRRLLQDIKERKQKKGEPFVAFCSEIEGMFERMTRKYSERKRLKVLRNNMRRWYKTKLSFYKIKNIAHLSLLCQQLDKDSGKIYSKYTQPLRKHIRNVEASSDSSSSSSEEAGICAYEKKERQWTKDKTKPSSVIKDPAKTPETLKQPEALCWNCRKYGHRWRDCKQPKLLFCHACGTPGVTFFTCPNNHRLPNQAPKNEYQEEE